MNENQDERFGELIRNAVEPVVNREAGRDLWPGLQQRMPKHHVKVSVFDWVLVALALFLITLSPGTIFGLLAHL